MKRGDTITLRQLAQLLDVPREALSIDKRGSLNVDLPHADVRVTVTPCNAPPLGAPTSSLGDG